MEKFTIDWQKIGGLTRPVLFMDQSEQIIAGALHWKDTLLAFSFPLKVKSSAVHKSSKNMKTFENTSMKVWIDNSANV